MIHWVHLERVREKPMVQLAESEASDEKMPKKKKKKKAKEKKRKINRKINCKVSIFFSFSSFLLLFFPLTRTA